MTVSQLFSMIFDLWSWILARSKIEAQRSKTDRAKAQAKSGERAQSLPDFPDRAKVLPGPLVAPADCQVCSLNPLAGNNYQNKQTVELETRMGAQLESRNYQAAAAVFACAAASRPY